MVKGLYYCGMHAVNVNSIMDDPLAGCWAIVQHPPNATNMLRAVLLRLRIVHTEDVSTSIGDQVIAEAGKLPINRYQYCINEILYETRRGQTHKFDPMYEAVILNNWAKEMLEEHDQDTVLDIIGALKKNREARKR